MSRFFAYARKSPTGYTNGRTAQDAIPSLDRQEADLYRMMDRLPDVEYAGCWREHESAVEVPWNKRTVLANLLDELRQGDHLGVWRLDRLERHPFRLMHVLQVLVDKGVEIHAEMSMNGIPVDLTTAMGRGIIMMLAWASDMNREYQKDACRRGLAWRRKCGMRIGWPPLGCVWVPIPGKLTRFGTQEYRAEWSPEECDTIRRIRRMHAEGTRVGAIVRWARINGIRRACGSRWEVHNVKRAIALYNELLAQGNDLGSVPLSVPALDAAKAYRLEAEAVQSKRKREQRERSLARERERIAKVNAQRAEETKAKRLQKDAAVEAERNRPVPAWAIRLWQTGSAKEPAASASSSICPSESAPSPEAT